MIPVYSFLQGDTIGLLLLVDDDATATSFAALAQRSSSVRVAPRQGPRVRFGDRVLGPAETLRAVGVGPLDRLDVDFPERP